MRPHQTFPKRLAPAIARARRAVARGGAALLLLQSGLLALAPAVARADATRPGTRPGAFTAVLSAKAGSKKLCESRPDRLHVEAETRSECIAYFVTKGNEANRHAVLFLDGDVPIEKFDDQDSLDRARAAKHRFMQAWANRTGQRFVDISRLGVHGSSGNHGERRKPHETIIMNGAIDRLRERLGLDTVTLAGQSGGSTIAAAILTFGRRDVTCAVLGSGAYEIVALEHAHRAEKGAKVTLAGLAKAIYDPSAHVAGIERNPRRRIFIIGDPADARTPFAQQVRFAEAIRSNGHHARVFAIDAAGALDHDAARHAIPLAGACARGDNDEVIRRDMPRRGTRPLS